MVRGELPGSRFSGQRSAVLGDVKRGRDGVPRETVPPVASELFNTDLSKWEAQNYKLFTDLSRRHTRIMIYNCHLITAT